MQRLHVFIPVAALLIFAGSTQAESDTRVGNIDITSGQSYSSLERSGLSLEKGSVFREGARSSDSIHERKLRVIYAPGKEFTLESQGKAGLVGVSPDEKKIDFYSLNAAYDSESKAIAKVKQIGAALGFDGDTFESALKSERFLRSRTKTVWQNQSKPFWSVEFKHLPSLSLYEIKVVFTWDAEALMQLGGYAYSVEDRLK